jgi:hypothetical protein
MLDPPPLHEVVSRSSIDLISRRISAGGLARRLRGLPFALVLFGKDTEIFGQAKAGDRSQLWVQPDGHAQTIIIVMNGT